MSKAISKGLHWMPRTSEFSTHGQRNGRVDVLPPSASLPTFGDLSARYDQKKAEYKELFDIYLKIKKDCESDSVCSRWLKAYMSGKADLAAIPSRSAKKLDELKIAKDEMCGAAARLQDFRVIFNEAGNVRYERAWIETAKAMLPWDVVSKIEETVQQNLKRQERA